MVHVGQPQPRKSWSPVRMPTSRVMASATGGQSLGSRGTRRRATASWLVRVEGAREDLDHSVVDKGMHGLVQQPGLLGGEATLIHHEVEAVLEFVLGFVPLLFGDHHPQVGTGEERPTSLAE